MSRSKQEIEQELYPLIASLTHPTMPLGDYKVIRCMELWLVKHLTAEEKAALPYDIDDLHRQREPVRERIAALKKELEEAE